MCDDSIHEATILNDFANYLAADAPADVAPLADAARARRTA
jgi:hypothetical protein